MRKAQDAKTKGEEQIRKDTNAGNRFTTWGLFCLGHSYPSPNPDGSRPPATWSKARR